MRQSIGFVQPKSKRPRVGLCLPGGGAAGAFQAGALMAFHSMRDDIEAIASASVGSLNAAMFLQSLDDGNTNALWEIWAEIKPRDVYRRWKIFKLCSDSLFSAAPLDRMIDDLIDPDILAQSPIAWYCQATDSDTGEAAIAREDDPNIADWIRASAALPVLFPEVQINGRWYRDGGCADNTPMMPLIDHGCDTIIVVNCHPRTEYKPRKRRLTRIEAAIDTVQMLFQGNQNHDLRRIERINKRVLEGTAAAHYRYIHVISIEPEVSNIGVLDFDCNKVLKALAEGYRKAVEVVKQYYQDRLHGDSATDTHVE